MRICKVRCVVFFALAACLTTIALHFSSGFSLSKVLLPEEFKVSVSELPELSASYRYLSHGRQCFVFEDETTVLKVFNQSYFRKHWYHVFFFWEGWKKPLEEKLRLRERFYKESYPLAFLTFPEETKILYVHMQPTTHLPSIDLFDPSGRKIALDLNEVAFVLQKKAKPYLEHMEEVYVLQGIEGIKQEIDQWISLCKLRISRNISDYDHDIWSNVGVVEGKPIFLDPGKFSLHPKPFTLDEQHVEWWKATHRLRKWLLTKNEELVEYLDNKVQSNIHESEF